MIHYFAYGSNLHPVRLTERIPSTTFAGTAVLPGYRLAWHKRGMDDSGKCFILPTGHEGDVIHGAIYRIAPEHKTLLDEFEGPGYRDEVIRIGTENGALECLAYIARDSHTGGDLLPFHWYRQLVILGARYHGFPPAYIADSLEVDSIEDTDRERRRQHEALLARLEAWTGDD